MPCPCGHVADYKYCCGRFHMGTELPETAVELMRSRYCAFVKHQVTYLKETTWPANKKHFDEAGYRERAASSIWLGLEIHSTAQGSPQDSRGTVTFTARSMINGTPHDQTEKSLFRKKAGRWYYVKSLE